jgi:UDP-glucose 4-epimerase
VTGIVHLAVPPTGAGAGQSIAEDYRINMAGLINVLEAGRMAGVRRVSLASSVAIYAGISVSSAATYTGPLLTGPFKEDMTLPMTANNPTTAFKKAFEVLGDYYGGRTGLDVVSLRIAGIYGPLYHSMSNLPSRLVHAALKGEPGPLSRPGQTVPFEGAAGDSTYAKDCAKGIQMVHMATGLKHKVYNIGSGRATSGAEMADAVRAVFPDAKIALQAGPGPNAVADNYLDLTRTTADTGWAPHYTPERGVADYVEWLRAGNAQ